MNVITEDSIPNFHNTPPTIPKINAIIIFTIFYSPLYAGALHFGHLYFDHL